MTVQGSDLDSSRKRAVTIAHEQNISCSKTRLDGTRHEQTIICWSRDDSRPMKRKKRMHRMMIKNIVVPALSASFCYEQGKNGRTAD